MDASDREPAAASRLPASAISALQRGNKIEAIKIVREERRIGLKEAKDAVDQYLQSQPALQSSFAAAQAEAKQKALRWVAALVFLAFLAYYFLTRP